jgi:dTDP-4-amino-4,6-dideoxygalactose transaminase
MKVPFVNFGLQYRNLKDEIDGAIGRCLERGDFINRQDLKSFEENFARYIGVKHAIGVLSGTDALFLCLKALNIGPGDEVITVDHTYIATIDVIVHCGAKPVLVDVDYTTMNMDVLGLVDAISTQTKAIIPVHLNGRVAQMDSIKDLAARYRIPIIEDAAQACGASFMGEKAGSFGKAGCFSFYPSKPLGGIGEGGMIATDDDEFADRLLKLRHHGDEPGKKRGKIYCWGYNSILENINAAVLNCKLPYIEEWNTRRKEIALKYECDLRDYVMTPPCPDASMDMIFEDIYAYYVIRIETRDELAAFLKAQEIETMVYLSVPNHMQEGIFRKEDFCTGYYHESLEISKQLSKECLCLPMYPELTDDQVDYVIEKVREFVEEKS